MKSGAYVHFNRCSTSEEVPPPLSPGWAQHRLLSFQASNSEAPSTSPSGCHQLVHRDSPGSSLAGHWWLEIVNLQKAQQDGLRLIMTSRLNDTSTGRHLLCRCSFQFWIQWYYSHLVLSHPKNVLLDLNTPCTLSSYINHKRLKLKVTTSLTIWRSPRNQEIENLKLNNVWNPEVRGNMMQIKSRGIQRQVPNQISNSGVWFYHRNYYYIPRD